MKNTIVRIAGVVVFGFSVWFFAFAKLTLTSATGSVMAISATIGLVGIFWQEFEKLIIPKKPIIDRGWGPYESGDPR